MGEYVEISAGLPVSGFITAALSAVALAVYAFTTRPGGNDDDDSTPGGGLMQPVA